MSDVRANAGVPTIAQFGGATTPSACAPVVVDSLTGFIYTWKTGDVIVAAGAAGSGTVASVAQTFTGGLVSVAGSPITTSGTLALTVAGTSGGIPYFSGAATWASSAALVASAIVLGGGAGFAPATTTTGTGVVTALGVNVGSAGAFVTFNGALGTPSSGTATNLSGTAAGLTAGTVTTNANLTGPVTSTGNATAFATGVLTSGYFTPAITAETNTTATMSDIKWCRVNVDTVVMSGQFTADPVLAATVTSFEFSIPAASNIGAVSDLSGTAFCGAIAGMGAEIIGVVANDTAKVRWIASDLTSQTWSWVAEYRVI